MAVTSPFMQEGRRHPTAAYADSRFFGNILCPLPKSEHGIRPAPLLLRFPFFSFCSGGAAPSISNPVKTGFGVVIPCSLLDWGLCYTLFPARSFSPVSWEPDLRLLPVSITLPTKIPQLNHTLPIIHPPLGRNFPESE